MGVLTGFELPQLGHWSWGLRVVGLTIIFPHDKAETRV